VLARRPAQPLRVLTEHGGHHLQAGADGQGQQALLRRPGDLGYERPATTPAPAKPRRSLRDVF
jgi:hypothetical protein